MFCNKALILFSSLTLLACGSPGVEFDVATMNSGNQQSGDLQVPQPEAKSSGEVQRGSYDEYGEVVQNESPPAVDSVAEAQVDLPGMEVENAARTIENSVLPVEAKKKSEVADNPSAPAEAVSTIRYEDVVTLSQVVDVCNSISTSTLTRMVRFESNREEPEESWECEYTASDVNNRLRHFAVHTQEIPVPENAILCNLEFVHQEENFYYDDHLFFLFNDLILMSSYDYGASQNLEKHNDFYKFDWDKIFNASQHDHEEYEPYCVAGPGSCKLPKTQKEGATVMNFLHNKTVSQQLFLYGKEEQKFNLSIAVTGDNNSKVDCRHSDLSLETKVTFVVLD